MISMEEHVGLGSTGRDGALYPQPPDGLPEVLGLERPAITAPLRHIKSLLHHFPYKHLCDARHRDHHVLRYRAPRDGLHQTFDGRFGEGRATVHLIPVQLVFGEVGDQHLDKRTFIRDFHW